MNYDKVMEVIKTIVMDVCELEEKKLQNPEARFAEDLGVDSMAALEIVSKIEKTLRLPIPEERIPDMRSLKDVCDLVLKLAEEKV
ncbi:MAG: acyl carrier protein [Desulfobacterales bacterium]|nr:acyl carrier protein [Desulfobacterales bacterium]